MKGVNGDFHFVESSKHEVRLPYEFNLYIMIHVIDQSETWKKLGYPNKYRSIDFTIKKWLGDFYGKTFYVIPYDGAKVAVSKGLLGNNMPNLTKIFNPHKDSYPFSDPTPQIFTKAITQCYDKNFHKKFDYNVTINCINELSDFLKNKNVNDITEEEGSIMKQIKMDMDKRNISLLEILDLYFNPIDNDIKLLKVNELYDLKKEQNCGWTDSNALLVDDHVYAQIKNKFNNLKF